MKELIKECDELITELELRMQRMLDMISDEKEQE